MPGGESTRSTTTDAGSTEVGIPSAGLTVTCDAGGVRVPRAETYLPEDPHAGRTGGPPAGATFGPVTASQAHALVHRLRHSDDPDRHAQDLPWAACAARSDGSLAITCSTQLRSGLYWAREPAPAGWRLCAATDPLAVVRELTTGSGPDEDYLRAFILGSSPVTATPFRGVHRLPAGDTLTFHPGTGQTATTQWCGPDTLPPPTRSGERVLQRYLDTFDEVVGALVEVAGPLVTTVSGGLDSTFLAAALALHCPRGELVHGFCHSPLPEAGLPPIGPWEPDDFPYAQLMAEHYPGVLTVTALRNEARVHPLDAAAAAYRASGWPGLGPTNDVWINAFLGNARRLGARLHFLGAQGNATFSANHAYAPRHYLDAGRPAAAVRSALAGPGGPLRRALRLAAHRIRPPHPTGPTGSARTRIGLIGAVPPRSEGGEASRAGYLRWTTSRIAGWQGAMNPARSPGLLAADPFAARSIIETAASIEPFEWRRGTTGRALARRLGQGRVPERIRTRTTRGGQAWDAWFVVRSDLPRLAAEIDEAAGDELVRDILDRSVLNAWLDQARERPATGSPLPETEVVLQFLAAVRYARWLRIQLLPAGV